MNLFRVYQVSNDITIILSIFIILIMITAIYFLARSFFKERTRLRDERSMTMEGVLTRAEMTSLITSQIARAGKEAQFSLVYLDLDKFTDFINAFGQSESIDEISKLI